MTDDHGQSDLFGEAPSQGFMFDEPVAEPPKPKHTPETIRALLTSLIAELRAAETMPWDARTLRGHKAMAPYMAEWLKDGEGEQLLLEFRDQVTRLEGTEAA